MEVTMRRPNLATVRRFLCGAAICSLTLVSACGGSSEGGSAPVAQAVHNPADVYRSVHTALGSSFLKSIDDDSATAAEISAKSEQIGRLLDASRVAECDFGVYFAEGIKTQLPYLTQQRGLARVLKADAARLMAAGDREGAAKRIAAIHRMSAQIGASAQCHIEYLVAVSIAELANAFTQENPSLASAAWKTDIQQAMAEVDRHVYTRAPSILKQEGIVFATWLRSTSDPEYATTVTVGLKPRSADRRQSDAAKLEAHCAEIAAQWASAHGASSFQSQEAKAKSAGIEDLAPDARRTRDVTEKAKASAARAQAILTKG